MWKKLGKIFELEEGLDSLLYSHAANPTALHISGDLYRIFFNARNQENKSSVSSFLFDMKSLSCPPQEKPKLELAFGAENSFYSHGISIGNIYNSGSEKFMMFMGWQIRNNEHWRGDIGRIKILENGKLIVHPEEPFMISNQEDPISLSYPWVLFDSGEYKMWYGSTESWDSTNGEMIHVIKSACSADGENWTRNGLAIPYELGVAQAFSRPSVIKTESGYHSWYSYRSGDGTLYRIGYAHSANGITWKRKHDETGIDVSDSGWDSEMICYPFVFNHKGHRYMLYNGNGFGKSGIGLAIWE